MKYINYELHIYQIFLILSIIMVSSCGMNRTNDRKNIDSTLSVKEVNVETGYSTVNGIRMYYEIHGSGKPLVLLHGGGSTIQTSFGRILPLLAKNRQVIGVELQAHGHTQDRDAPLSFEQDAKDVAALLKNLNIDKADFLGFSNGGTTALQIALRYPELANKVIVASALFKRNGTDPQFWDFMKQARLEQMPKQYQEIYLQVAPDPKGLQVMHDKCVQRMLTFKDWSDQDLKSIKIPVLVMSGDHDVTTPEHAVELYRLIPDCQLIILPGGHGKYLGELTTLTDNSNSEVFTAVLIEEFLDKTK